MTESVLADSSELTGDVMAGPNYQGSVRIMSIQMAIVY